MESPPPPPKRPKGRAPLNFNKNISSYIKLAEGKPIHDMHESPYKMHARRKSKQVQRTKGYCLDTWT